MSAQRNDLAAMRPVYFFSRPSRTQAIVFGTNVLHWVVAPIAIILATSLLIYLALSAAPGDPIAQILGSRSTPEQRALLAQQLGLNLPAPVRYWHWLTHALTGDLGLSFAYRQPVVDIIGPRIGTTLSLVVYSALIIVTGGITVGSLSGLFKKFRPFANILIGLGVALPGYVVALVLVSVFSVNLRWFPTYGAGVGFADSIWHLTLPAIALSVGWNAYVAQITSAAVAEEVAREHVLTARARGLHPFIIFRRHIMRNAAVPVMTTSGLAVAGLVAGSVIVETAFAIDGIGALLVRSVLAKDYSVVTAVAVLIVTVFVAITTLIEAIQNIIDPLRR